MRNVVHEILPTSPAEDSPEPAYAYSGKIQHITKIIIIVGFIFYSVVTLIHHYLLFASRRRDRYRQTQLVFSTRRLDASVHNSLPVFLYSSKTHPESTPNCSVCLSDFEENEKGRTLPKCGHTFHLECIDMWFQSHSTCPLCRTDVKLGPVSETPDEVVLAVGEPERIDAGSSSGLCSDCEHEDKQVGQPRRRLRPGENPWSWCVSPLRCLGGKKASGSSRTLWGVKEVSNRRPQQALVRRVCRRPQQTQRALGRRSSRILSKEPSMVAGKRRSESEQRTFVDLQSQVWS